LESPYTNALLWVVRIAIPGQGRVAVAAAATLGDLAIVGQPVAIVVQIVTGFRARLDTARALPASSDTTECTRFALSGVCREYTGNPAADSGFPGIGKIRIIAIREIIAVVVHAIA
jgi:hypothetical protein